MSAIDDKLNELNNAGDRKEQLLKLQELLGIAEFRDELNNVGLLGYMTAKYMDLALEPLRETLNKKLSWREMSPEVARNVIANIKKGNWVNTNDIYNPPTTTDGEYNTVVDDVIDVLKKVSIYPEVAHWSEYLSTKLKAAYAQADWVQLNMEGGNYGDNKSYFTDESVTEEAFKEKAKNWLAHANDVFTQAFTQLTEWEQSQKFTMFDARFLFMAFLKNTYFWNDYIAARNDEEIAQESVKIGQQLLETVAASFPDNNAEKVEDLIYSLYKKYRDQFKNTEENQSTEDMPPQEEEPQEDISNSDT